MISASVGAGSARPTNADSESEATATGSLSDFPDSATTRLVAVDGSGDSYTIAATVTTS